MSREFYMKSNEIKNENGAETYLIAYGTSDTSDQLNNSCLIGLLSPIQTRIALS